MQQDIKKFIKDNATKESIRKAQDYDPQIDNIRNNNIYFSCQGSEVIPYRIVVNIVNGIQVSCTCLYDGSGLCKHQVAALQVVDTMINAPFSLTSPEVSPKSPSKKSTGQTKTAHPRTQQKKQKQVRSLVYRLQKGDLIDFNLISKDFRKHGMSLSYYSHISCGVCDFDPGGSLTLAVDSLSDREEAKLTVNHEKHTVRLTCSCSKKEHNAYCDHLLVAVDFVQDVLGADILTEGYVKKHVAQHIGEYGLTLDDDYQKYFDFYMQNDGFFAKPKNDNLVKSGELPLAELPPMLPAKIAAQKPADYGMGLIFEYSGREFQNFISVTAKYDKQHTELATHFKVLNEYDAQRQFATGAYTLRDQDIYFKAQQLNYLLERYDYYDNEDALQRAIAMFAECCTTFDDYPIYAHKLGDTHARKNLQPLTINRDEGIALQFQFSEDELFYHLTAKIVIGGKALQANSNKLNANALFIRRDNEILPFTNPQLSADVCYYHENPKLAFTKKDAEQFKDTVLTPLSQRYEIKGKDITVKKIRKAPEKTKKTAKNRVVDEKTPVQLPERQVYVSENDGLVFFRLAVQYPEKLIDVHSHEMRLSVNDKGEFETLPRDSKMEQDFIAEFETLHDDFADSDGVYALTPEKLIEDFWFLDTAHRLQDAGIHVLGAKELKSFRYNLNKPTSSVSVKSDIDWFDVELDIQFGDQQVNLKDLQKAFVKKQNYIELKDGTIGMLPEKWMAQFAHYFKVGEVKKDHIQISNYQFGVIDELYENLEEKPPFLIDLYERKQRLNDLHLQDDIAVPEGIDAELRPYQQHGLNWMNFLHDNRLGGCLADDMGLGKTLQTIAFLQHLKVTQAPDKPSLIVAPTSLIFNWQNEVGKFCPTLKILNFTGINRMSLLADFTDYDIVLTTYGSLLKDIEKLKNIKFHYAILDESQAVKNPQSQRYKAVRLLKADNRLILTGTPIENNTFDLYAQFNFLNPGLLGNISHFRKEFADAIDKGKDVQTSELLAKLVNPFILRRTKEQVATELPPKVESVMYCEMGNKQRKVYEAVKQEYRDALLSTIDDKGIEKSQMYILEGLMKLRQICNSPALLADEADYGSESVKLDMLIENIKEKTGQHKILVFSSFVKMLKIIQSRLKSEKIACEYLDGRTRNRQKKVENFQKNADIRVFLISTKAGGTGLNLTEADYVFIVDPWWNPAVENQAIDRSYRIGQRKHVMAYRMICTDSIEEKILALQEKKKGIADSIISVDSEKKSFNLEEVKNLFA